ncbi:MAG: hypothetical protein FJ263_11210 [Planctomycetes bacterium]|nr:hypothetical protein [Planctomycetota bacterium]
MAPVLKTENINREKYKLKTIVFLAFGTSIMHRLIVRVLFLFLAIAGWGQTVSNADLTRPRLVPIPEKSGLFGGTLKPVGSTSHGFWAGETADAGAILYVYDGTALTKKSSFRSTSLKLAAVPGGEAINITSAGTGTHTLYYGAGFSQSTTFGVVSSTGYDQLALLVAVLGADGVVVRVSSTGTLPAGLAADTDYYVRDLVNTDSPDKRKFNGIYYVWHDEAQNLYLHLAQSSAASSYDGVAGVVRSVVLRSTDGGSTWVLLMSSYASDSPTIRLPFSNTQLYPNFCNIGGGRILYAHYGDSFFAREIYGSQDNGATWTTLFRIASCSAASTSDCIRHFHGIQYFKNKLYIHCGDSDHHAATLICDNIDDFFLGDARINGGMMPGTDCWATDWKTKWGCLDRNDTITRNSAVYTIIDTGAPNPDQILRKNRPGMDPNYLLNAASADDLHDTANAFVVNQDGFRQVNTRQIYRLIQAHFETYNGEDYITFCPDQLIWESGGAYAGGGAVWRQNLTTGERILLGRNNGKQGFSAVEVDGIIILGTLPVVGDTENKQYAVTEDRTGIYLIYNMKYTKTSYTGSLPNPFIGIGYCPALGGIPMWTTDNTGTDLNGLPNYGSITVYRIFKPFGRPVIKDSFNSNFLTTANYGNWSTIYATISVENTIVEPGQADSMKITPTTGTSHLAKYTIPSETVSANLLKPFTFRCKVYMASDFNLTQEVQIRIDTPFGHIAAYKDFSAAAGNLSAALNQWNEVILNGFFYESGTYTIYLYAHFMDTVTGDRTPIYISNPQLRLGMYSGFAETDSLIKTMSGLDPSADCPNPSSMDRSGDCKVDMTDFIYFASEWMTCGLLVQENCWP